jgi:hypothetical protein
MASVEISVRYEGVKFVEEIPIRDNIEESIRRVSMKRGASVVDEVSYQLANEVILEITNKHVIRNLIRSVVKQLRDEDKVEKEV